MNTLIVKLNATGDVVRTTPLLRRLDGHVTWLTAQKNCILLEGLTERVRCVSWERRAEVLDSTYDLVISLEDEAEVAGFLDSVRYAVLFGSYINEQGQMSYTNSSRGWFDLSLISAYGRKTADELKLLNRRTYQELIFEGLGMQFEGDQYILPEAVETDLVGDVAIAPIAGPVWPMKNWAYYDDLKVRLEANGLRVNVLPHRESLLEHIGDVRNHRCLVGGDSLPMHLALGTGTSCVTIFNCTSPWEIHDYGLQTKLVSPLLERFFYKRDFDSRATTAIAFEQVLHAVEDRLSACNAVAEIMRMR